MVAVCLVVELTTGAMLASQVLVGVEHSDLEKVGRPDCLVMVWWLSVDFVQSSSYVRGWVSGITAWITRSVGGGTTGVMSGRYRFAI